MEKVKKRFYLTNTGYPEQAFDATTGEYNVTDKLVVDEDGNPVTEKMYKDDNIVYVDNRGNLHAPALDEVVVTPKESLSDKILLTNVRRNNTAVLNSTPEGGKVWSGLKEGGDLAGNLIAGFASGITPANPIRFASEMAGGVVGGATVDAITKGITGKTWTPFIVDKTGIRPEVAAMTNPGFWYGASKAGKIIDKGLPSKFIKGDPEIGWNALNKKHWALNPKNLTPTNVAFATANRVAPFLSEVGKDLYRIPAYAIAKRSKGNAFVSLKDLKKSKPDYTGAMDDGGKNLVAKYLFEGSPIISKTPWFKNISSKFKPSEESLPIGDRYKELYPGIENRTYVMDSAIPYNKKVYFPTPDHLREYAPIGKVVGKEAGVPIKTETSYLIHQGDNPIAILDDVAGHIIKLAPDKKGQIYQYSQDLYKFNPVDYMKKWGFSGTPILEEKQVSLMNNIGTPYKLFTKNPVAIGAPGYEASLYTSRRAVPYDRSLLAPYDDNAFMAYESPRVRYAVGSYAKGGTLDKKVNNKFKTFSTGMDPWGGYWRSGNVPIEVYASSTDGLYTQPNKNLQDVSNKKAIQTISKQAWDEVYDKFKNELNLTDAQYNLLMGQLLHETGDFSNVEEIGSGSRYEGRTDLGNTSSGDGQKYKGRGPIQLTGKANYEAVQRWFDRIGLSDEYAKATNTELDIVANPEVVANDPIIGAYATMGYITSVRPRTLKLIKESTIEKAEDVTPRSISALTKAINGGYNGLADRVFRTRQLFERQK